MREFLLVVNLVLLFVFNSSAQIQIVGKVDKTEFPQLEFILHDRNPELSKINDFQFFENIDGKKVKLDSVSLELVKDTTDYSKQNKCVLIMIEALYHKDRYEQVRTFFQALENSIVEIVNKGDKVKVVAFSLRDGSTNILKPVTSKFTDDVDEIIQEIEEYKINYNVYTKKPVSDIMGALEEGIDLLVDQDNTFPKSILLLSEERKNTYATLTANDITEKAKSKDIVINTIKYNRSGYHQYVEPTLSKETYGLSKVLLSSAGTSKSSNPSKVSESEDAIIDILKNSVQKASGNKYLIALTISDVTKDGLDKKIIIKQVDSENEITLTYTAPGNWIIFQFQKNLLLASGVSFLLLLLLVFVIWWIVDRKKKHKIILEQNKRRQEQIDKEQEAEILMQKQEISAMQEKQEQRINSEQLTQQNALKKSEELKLIGQMQELGAFPILKYSDTKNSARYEINTPITTVGRDAKSNKICIPNSNISRNHFSIIFSNNKYSVVDNNSTNGMIINGYKLKEVELKNGDIIEIADVTFTFYI
jgi:hypothetical protein